MSTIRTHTRTLAHIYPPKCVLIKLKPLTYSPVRLVHRILALFRKWIVCGWGSPPPHITFSKEFEWYGWMGHILSVYTTKQYNASQQQLMPNKYRLYPLQKREYSSNSKTPKEWEVLSKFVVKPRNPLIIYSTTLRVYGNLQQNVGRKAQEEACMFYSFYDII